jgi:hypothetical protein
MTIISQLILFLGGDIGFYGTPLSMVKIAFPGESNDFGVFSSEKV